MELYSEEEIRQTSRPEVGDVIVCEAFARGWRHYRREADNSLGEPFGPIRVMDVPLKVNSSHQDCHDDIRGEAKFVVEESHTSEGEISWPNRDQKFVWSPSHHSESAWLIRARRLRGDGTYDPDGELVEFTTYSSRVVMELARRTNAAALMEKWTNPENVARIVETPIRVVGRMERTVHFE